MRNKPTMCDSFCLNDKQECVFPFCDCPEDILSVHKIKYSDELKMGIMFTDKDDNIN